MFEDSVLEKKRVELKQLLIKECEDPETDSANKRKRIEAVLAELAKVRPVQSTADSRLLRKTWNLYVLYNETCSYRTIVLSLV